MDSDDLVTLHHGNCLDVLRALPAASVDAVVTDPPYEIAFMGRKWDSSGIAYDVDLWRECLRVAKPGAHLAAFGGTRTYHRLAVAIEDSGWEVRDSIAWLYGSGFPKSLDVSKAIDKQANAAPLWDALRAHLREWRDHAGLTNTQLNHGLGLRTTGSGMAAHWTRTGSNQQAIPTKEMWSKLKALLGWPDCELDEVYDAVKDGAERPVIGESQHSADRSAAGWLGAMPNPEGRRLITASATSEAEQWAGWGTALAPAHEPIVLARKSIAGTVARTVLEHGTGAINVEACKTSEGRWPKNVIIDEHVAADLGERARYFYCAKAPASERPKIDGEGWPTVKPLTLMRWLVRLLTPPHGLVLDPFAGTGTTLQAARDEGFPSLGVEADEFAYRLACQRLATDAALEHPLTLDFPAA